MGIVSGTVRLGPAVEPYAIGLPRVKGFRVQSDYQLVGSAFERSFGICPSLKLFIDTGSFLYGREAEIWVSKIHALPILSDE
jgi:hypothetical protein